MSISGQQQINIGLPNESINSDSLYTAFTKTQENFNTLFSCASPFTNFVGGIGITTSANPTTGTVTITNSGVTNIIAGTNITIDDSNGNVTISSTGGGGGGGGTVTSVGIDPVSTSRLVVTNSPVVSSGLIGIDLATSGAVAGSYSNPNVTVDAYGRVVNITNGPTVGTVTSVGLTAGPGISVAGGPVTSTGNISVTNTGVTKLTAGSGINLSSSNGNVTVSMSGAVGTVTSVGIFSTSLSVTGSPIVNSGSIRVELPTNPSATGTFTAGNLNTTGTLTVTGNANVGNIGAESGVFTSNVDAVNVNATTIYGTLATNAQPNVTSVGTLASLAVAGNITSGNANLGNNAIANFFTGSGQYLSAIQAGNVAGTVGNAANSIRLATTLQTTGIYYLPFIAETANANYGLNSNSAFSANIANGAIIATTFVGALSGAATSATTAGTVTNASQTTITTVGTLTSLAVSGNANFDSGTLFVDSVNNRVGIGTTGPSFELDINGNANAAAAVIRSYNSNANSNAQVAYQQQTTTVTGLMSTSQTQLLIGTTTAHPVQLIANNISSIYLASNNNVGIGNSSPADRLSVTGNVAVSANVTSGNLITGGVLSVTGNANVGNIGAAAGVFTGAISVSANVTGGNLLTGGLLSVTGNANVGNIGAATGVFTANVSAANVITTGFHIRSIATGLTAAGATQGTASAITKEVNVVSTVAVGTGVILPTAVAGMAITITNTTANSLLVYPATGGVINTLATNAGFTQPAGATIQFIAPTNVQWYTVGATYA